MSSVLSAPDISRALSRIAHEICERNNGASSITLLGIPTRGAHLAKRIAEIISKMQIARWLNAGKYERFELRHLPVTPTGFLASLSQSATNMARERRV